MNIAVVGVGYVGLVTGTCFAEMGNQVWCVDIDAGKIDALNRGEVSIYEPGLESMLHSNKNLGHLNFTTSLPEALEHAEFCFIAVGTPPAPDGDADLSFVRAVAVELGQHMCRHMYVVNKSTVPVGTARMVREIIQRELDARQSALTFDVISNPEFLKEGAAIGDCMRPDRIVIGTDNEEAADVMRDLYGVYVKNTDRFIMMDIESAEMTKYVANAMLATKISFMNEISNICERVGANVNMVRLGIGSDSRIGYNFIYAGCGYGGSCFPKDMQALIALGKKNAYEPHILEAVESVNYNQKKIIPAKIVKHFGEDLSARKFAVWGLSFKPDTDDMREAPSLTIINELLGRGAKIVAYDPKAVPRAMQLFAGDSIEYVESKYEALKGADALILITEWREFRQPDFGEIAKLLKQPIIFDGRNQFNPKTLKRFGIEYHQIGVMPVPSNTGTNSSDAVRPS